MASKKGFKSVATQFISANTDNTQNTDNTPTTDNTHNKQDTPAQTSAVKGAEPVLDTKRYGKRAAGDDTERKSKRLNLLVKPSTLAGLQKIATMKQCSTNELIQAVMQQYVDDHQDTIKKYDSVFGGEQ